MLERYRVTHWGLTADPEGEWGKYADAQVIIADLQGQVEKWQEIASLRFAGDHKFVKEMELLKVENSALQQRVAQLEGELEQAKTLRDRWQAKLDKEESEHFMHTLELVALRADHARVLGLVQALPYVKGALGVQVAEVELGDMWGITVDGYFDGNSALFETKIEANAYMALVKYRASLPAQPAQGGA